MRLRSLPLTALLLATACAPRDVRPDDDDAHDTSAVRSASPISARETTGGIPADPTLSLEQQADSVAARLAAAINGGDVATVARAAVLPGLEPDTAAARVSIAGLRHHFGRQAIQRAELVAADAGSPGHREYALVSADGRRKSIVVYFEPQLNGFRAYDEFLLHFPRAERLAPAVVEAIRGRDSVRLGRLFTPDDIDYPPSMAAGVIREYARRFDLGTLAVRYAGLEPERRAPEPPDVHRRFVYVVTGTKDGRPVEHRVHLGHGDGMVWWSDPLVPDPPQP